ncbi:MAG: alpha/beta fold hydrolase [Balneolaceae bacterium]
MKLIEPQKFFKKFELLDFPQPEIYQLKYPVFMCHGYGGIAGLVRPAPIHVPCMTLRSHGIHAFAPNIVPYATIATRAEQWVEKIEQLKEQYGYEKFNVVGHSMGGLDMRYAISKLGIADSVASLTTVATPHHGTSLAELVLTTPGLLREKLGEVFDWFGESIFPNAKSNAVAAVEQLTREYVTEEFNTTVEDHEQVTYFSFSAAVGKGTNHPLNPIYRFQNAHIYNQEGLNDSFVSVESATWGTHVQTSPISHMEQLDLQVSKERKKFVEYFWLDLVQHLKKSGL